MKRPTTENPTPVVIGDSFEILESLPDDWCDHVITDPPYAEKTHAGARTNKKNDSKLIHFDSISDDQFLWLCRQFVRVAKRWVLMTCDWRHAAVAEQAIPDEFIRVGVWTKPDGCPQLTGDRPATGWEPVLMLHRKGRKKWNGGGHPAVWHYGIARNAVHPTQKPLSLIRKWVNQFTDPGELILDPFAGSCSTALGCLYEGRRCLSIEKDVGFAEAGKSRLSKLQDPDSLVAYKPRNYGPDAPLF